MQAQTQTPKYQGEPSVQALATGLGTLGRYGDEYMIHAAHGETVIPAEILAANPELKNQLFQQMRMMGIRDPNRYVVGNSLNSINPLTGQPEFFFKRIFRAIRKVIKKIAPIVVPILGNMIAPGIGGPIASALYSKATGGSWGDALKSAALSYGASALGSGLKGIMSAAPGTGMSGFWSGLKAGAMAPWDAASNIFSSGAQNPLAQGIFGPRGMGLAFKGAEQTLGSSFAPGGNWWQKAAGTVFPQYSTTAGVGGNTTQLGSQGPVTATQAQNAQLSGYNADGTMIAGSGGGQPGASGFVPGGGGGGGYTGDVNQVRGLQPIPGVKGGSGVQYQSGTFDPATAMTPGSNAVQGVYTPQSGYTTAAGDAVNVSGDAVTSAVGASGGSSGSTLGNAWDWINRNRLLALAGAGGLYYLSQDEEDPVPDRDEFLAMSDPERLAYEQFTALSDAEKRGTRGNELLRQSGIAPRYSPTEIARITGIPHADAVNFYAGAYGGNTLDAAKGGVANFAWGGGSIADFIKRRDSGFASPTGGMGSLLRDLTNKPEFRKIFAPKEEEAPLMDLKVDNTGEDGDIIEAEGEVVGTGPVQRLGMPELGTLTTGGNDLRSANQITLQQRGEGAPFVFEGNAYVAKSSGAELASAPQTQGMPQLGTPTPPESMQTGLGIMTGSPNLIQRLTSGQGQVNPNGQGITGGGNPLFLKMVEQAQNAMNNRQPVGSPTIMSPNRGGNPFVKVLQQVPNSPLLTKHARNNTETGIQLAKQNDKQAILLGGYLPANQAIGQLRAANGGEIEGPGTGTSDSIPANLSDGEFVMTAEAVRNAGGGDRNLGAARMYDLMNRFEGGRA